MNNLKITARLAISIVFLLLALAILLHAYIGTISRHIEIAQQERNGLAYMRPLMKALDALGDQYALKLALDAGDVSANAKMTAATRAVDAAFAEVQAADSQLGVALEFTTDGLRKRQREQLALPNVLKKWKAISAADPKTVATAQYDALIDDIKGMVTHINETSMLMTDPDVYTVYLMEATMLVLPNSMARIAQGQYPVYHALAEHTALDYALKERAWALSAFLEQNDIARVDADMRISYNQQPSYYGTASRLKAETEGALAKYDTASKTLVQTLQKLAMTNAAPAQADFLKQSETARNAAYNFWKANTDQLDLFLQQRIDHFSGARDLAMLKAAILIAIGLGFFWYVTHGIITSLKKLQKAMGEVGGGNFEYEIPCLDHRDEIGSIARTLELFRKSYWWLS